MDWYQHIFELIDMRSFSNMWFWIALAVLWSTTSHYVLGIPFDMVLRARRFGGEAMTDLEDLVRIYVARQLYIARVSGLWLLGLNCFALTTLALLGFVYGVEFAQALLLLGLPLTIIGAMSLSTARLIEAEAPYGEELCKRLARHRLVTQIIGLISILITALWGMFQNMSTGPF